MTDWLGTTTFELDLLHQLTAATDHAGKRVEYTYDGVGNQTSIAYPDGTTATYDYDLVHNQTKVTETDGSETSYTYDGMGRVTEMRYPNGWVEYYTYDKMGRILKVEDTHPSEKPAKTQKHTYAYDANGNMTYEYMRGNGTGEATVENTYTYDALHRVTSVHENYGNDNRSYAYDSLGNLTYETAQGNKSVDYKLNNLNQITSSSDDGWKTSTTYTYDKRGNLVQELYTKNNKQSVTGAYTCDETNKMVQGVNDIGESSEYLYNGLGALVTNTWIIKKNAYGYHDVQLSAVVEGETVVDADSGKKAKKEKKTAEEVTASPELNKTSTVVKEFVVDYTTETYEPLMEHEVNGLDYRYVYGNDRLSVNITGAANGSGKLIENGNQIQLYYHMDYLGTADYLTSPLTGKVESWTHYNEWGEITHNAVLKCGQRELDMVKRYATHDYDQVLGMYYAKARFYDAENRRLVAVDPILDASMYSIKDYVDTPTQLVQYLYVYNNPIVFIDPLGRCFFTPNGKWAHDNWEFTGGYVLRENPRNSVLTYGCTGDAVKEMQFLLWKYKYLLKSTDVDGSFGPKTLDAVKRFQRANGLDDDGSVGPLTWAAFFEADVVKAKITVPVSQINTKADPTREKDIPTPDKGNPGTRFVGFGIQLEVNGVLSSRNTLGAEIVAYTDKYVLPEGRPWYQPYIFFYGGYSASSDDLMNIILNLSGKPSALTSPVTLANMLPHKVTASLCVFAIFGNETFLEPDDYAGAFTGGSLTVKHIKGYVAVCSSCTAVGVGYDMQFAGCGVSETYYVMVDPNVVANTFKELMQEAFGITQTIENKALA